jgi:hypothetical protein
MDSQRFRELHARRPFEPFRVHLINGRSYEVRDPDLLMVGRTSITIGLLDRERGDPIYDHLVTISLDNISELDMIAS